MSKGHQETFSVTFLQSSEYKNRYFPFVFSLGGIIASDKTDVKSSAKTNKFNIFLVIKNRKCSKTF